MKTLWDVGAAAEAVLLDGRIVRVITRDPGGDVYVHGVNGLEWLGGELKLRVALPVIAPIRTSCCNAEISTTSEGWTSCGACGTHVTADGINRAAARFRASMQEEE